MFRDDWINWGHFWIIFRMRSPAFVFFLGVGLAGSFIYIAD